MHIGILEDHPAIQEYLQKSLELRGHRVSVHTYGDTLLDQLFVGEQVLASLPYDVLIIDLNLPGSLSGQDIIFRIRETISPAMLPIIILSATDRYKLAQLQGLFPDIVCVQKPFKLQMLFQVLDTIKDGQ